MTTSEANKLFGQRVKELRRIKGWTQTELGERVGLSLPQIGRYERGIVASVSVDTVHQFADVFDVPEGDLVAR